MYSVGKISFLPAGNPGAVQYNYITTQLLHLFVISAMAKITNKCSNWVCIVYIKGIY